jgi:phosphoglycolate phosphatase
MRESGLVGVKAVIFDLDGTLLDTLGDIADSMNAVLARFSLPIHELDAYRSMVGSGMEALARRALPRGFRDEAVSGIVKALIEEYGRRFSATSRPYPGVPETLTALSEKGMPLAVLSNKPDAFTRLMVRTLLNQWDFREVRGLSPGNPRKPDPATALDIARTLGLPPEEIMFVGDSDIDMQTAERAGMRSVGVLWGYQDRERLVSGGAGIIVDCPQDLLACL